MKQSPEAHSNIRFISIPTALLVATLSVGLLGCPSGDSVRLGAVVPRTGESAVFGEAVYRGMQLAAEHLSAASEIPIELVVEDSTGSPEVAKEKLGELFGDGAVAAIGGVTTSEAEALVEVAERFDRLVLSPSASGSALTGISLSFSRIVPSGDVDTRKIADFAARNLKLESLAVLTGDDPAAQGLADTFQQEIQRHGSQVLQVFKANADMPAAEAARQVTELAPQGVYLAGYGSDMVEWMQALDAAGFKGKVLTTHAIASPATRTEAGQAASGVYFPSLEVDPDEANAQAFITAFEERFGEAPDLFAALGYDALHLLAEAANGAELPSKVAGSLRHLEDYPGVTGSIRIREDGDPTRYPRIFFVQDDLTVASWDRWFEEEQRKIAAKRKELEERMRKLREQAKSMG